MTSTWEQELFRESTPNAETSDAEKIMAFGGFAFSFPVVKVVVLQRTRPFRLSTGAQGLGDGMAVR